MSASHSDTIEHLPMFPPLYCTNRMHCTHKPITFPLIVDSHPLIFSQQKVKFLLLHVQPFRFPPRIIVLEPVLTHLVFRTTRADSTSNPYLSIPIVKSQSISRSQQICLTVCDCVFIFVYFARTAGSVSKRERERERE